jgi:hypothetical protein
MHVDRTGITEIGRFQHPEADGYAYPITRALVVGDRLLTIGAFGVRSGRLDTLAETSFTPFAG